MLSHGVNTSVYGLENITLTSVVNDEGAIIAGNPMDFAAALHVHVGYV